MNRKLVLKNCKLRCDLCNSSKFRILIDLNGDVMTSDRKIIKNQLRKVECLKCGLVSSIIPQNKSFVKESYEKKYSYNLSQKGDTYFFTQNGFQDRSSYVFEWILSVLTKKEIRQIDTIVEVGCGQGNLLSKFQQEFPEKKIIGLEVNDEAIRIGRKNGLDIRKFDERNQIKADLVISFAVIEHTISPRKFLHTLSNFLNPGGVILISQPHQDKVYYDVFFFDHLYHFSIKHMKYLGNMENLTEVRKSIGPWPIDSFSLHIYRKSKRKLKPKIKFIKTRVSDSIKYYNMVFQRINKFLKESNNSRLAVFGLGEIFSLFYTYTELKKTKIEYGIDDFPKKGYEVNFPIITSNEIQQHHIEKILICVNPHYYKILKNKISDDKRDNILFPFKITKSIISKN